MKYIVKLHGNEIGEFDTKEEAETYSTKVLIDHFGFKEVLKEVFFR